MAAKKSKGHVPLDILEKRYQKLGKVIRSRGGNTYGDVSGGMGYTKKKKGKK